jgi:EmrB/QacA subfamily drug resistance transporter
MKAPLASGHAAAVSGVLLVIFLFAIDSTVVSAAMPTIVGKLGGLELYSWVFSSYMLTSALATPLFGNLSDFYGRRRLMLVGIGLFTLASALCGAAHGIRQLIAFRSLQGIGGGAIYALSFILIGHLYAPERRAQIQAIVSGLWGVASILGPVAGAVITHWLNWRWIFFVNLPICLCAMALIAFGMSEPGVQRRHRIDVKGLIALLVGLLFLFCALEQVRRSGFALDWVSALLSALAVLALFGFYRIECDAEEPILPPALLRMRLFKFCLALAWLASMGMFAVITYLPLYVQGGLGGDAARVGLALIPASLGWTAGSFVAGGGMTRYGARAVCVAGSVLMALGYAIFVVIEPRLDFALVLAIGALIGLGMGMVTLTSMVAAQNGVPQARLGVATSTVMLARMFGGAFGVAVMGSVLFGRMQAELAALSDIAMPAAARGVLEKLAAPEQLLDPIMRAGISDSLLASLEGVLRDSVRAAFAAGLAVVILCAAAALFLPRPESPPTTDTPKSH